MRRVFLLNLSIWQSSREIKHHFKGTTNSPLGGHKSYCSSSWFYDKIASERFCAWRSRFHRSELHWVPHPSTHYLLLFPLLLCQCCCYCFYFYMPHMVTILFLKKRLSVECSWVITKSEQLFFVKPFIRAPSKRLNYLPSRINCHLCIMLKLPM